MKKKPYDPVDDLILLKKEFDWSWMTDATRAAYARLTEWATLKAAKRAKG